MKKANFLLLPLLGFMIAGCAAPATQDSGDNSSTKTSEVETNTNTSTKKEEEKTDWSESEKTLMRNCLSGYVFPFVSIKGGTWEELDDLYYFADNISVKEAHDYYKKVATLEGFTDVSMLDYDPSETESGFYRETEIFPEEGFLIHCVFGFTFENNESGHFAMMVEAPLMESKEDFSMESNQYFIQTIAGDEAAVLPDAFPFEFTYLYSMLYANDRDEIVAMTFTVYTENENCCDLFSEELRKLNLYTLGVDEWGDANFEGHGIYGWYMYQPGNKTFYLDIGQPEE